MSVPHVLPEQRHRVYQTTAWTIGVGHRGSGADNSLTNTQRSRIRENSILSLVHGGAHADFVEFDVHLTKDHVPIISHNFTTPLHFGNKVVRDALVSGNQVEVPVCTVTLAELNTIIAQREVWRAKSRVRNAIPDDDESEAPITVRNVASALAAAEAPGTPAKKPMSRTMSESDLVDKRSAKNVDVNLTADDIQTLESAFKLVPQGVGFNIEVKHPSALWESENNAHAESRNEVVNAVLRTVFKYATSERRVLFSSFDPDICVCLSVKQARYPVFFLTPGMVDETAVVYDMRYATVESAIAFATNVPLLGIVSNSLKFIEDHSLFEQVQRAGLLLYTYGESNNNPDNVQLQIQKGVDGVIADNVKALTRAIKDDDEIVHAAMREVKSPSKNVGTTVTEEDVRSAIIVYS